MRPTGNGELARVHARTRGCAHLLAAQHGAVRGGEWWSMRQALALGLSRLGQSAERTPYCRHHLGLLRQELWPLHHRALDRATPCGSVGGRALAEPCELLRAHDARADSREYKPPTTPPACDCEGGRRERAVEDKLPNGGRSL